MRLVIRARPCGLQPYPTGVILGTVERNLSQLSARKEIFILCSASFPRKDAAIEEKSTGIAPQGQKGQERLYDRTRSSRSVFVTALSGHFPKTIGYGAGSLKRNEEAVQSIPYDH